MTELRDLILMLTSVGILIAFGEWLIRNMPDALDYRARNLSDGDCVVPTKNPSAETERGDGLVGGRGACNATHFGDASNNNQRPLGSAK